MIEQVMCSSIHIQARTYPKEDTMASKPKNKKIHIERARFEMRRGDMNSARLILSRAANLPQKAGNLFNMWATLETKEVRKYMGGGGSHIRLFFVMQVV